jgi:two-component system, NtrC family, response regulator HydG
MSHTVLVVDDEPRYRALYAQVLSAAGIAVTEAGSAAEAMRLIDAGPPDMVVSDVRMPGASGLELLASARTKAADLPFLLVTAYGDVRDAVAALKLGAVDYLAKPVDLDELLACVQDALGIRPPEVPEEIPPEAIGDIVAEGPAMRGLLRDAWRVARSDVNVLLTGESGTGKEVLARFIHRNSGRARGPLVAVNCAAVPATLLASELFGHERGAFTGASTRRDGRFREAQDGTLFLDEIGDMPMELQPVLLRAIEQRAITPLGATGEIHVDFRLLAATNRPLEEDVAAGRFRADLFYRLDVISLGLPPLRERPEDIVPLARGFLAASGEPGKRISHAAARALLAYPWPGNVRELANAMQRARLLTRTEVILPDNLPPAVRQARGRAEENPVADGGTEMAPREGFQTLEQSEIASIRKALAATDGNRTRAAALLGITRRGLLKKVKRFGI